MDLLDLYSRTTAWTATKIPAAEHDLDASTPCKEWDVRQLLDHLIKVQEDFARMAEDGGDGLGEDVEGESLSERGDGEAAARYDRARQAMLDIYGRPGVLEENGVMFGIALVDQLVHGWDLATATAQDATMPPDLAESAFEIVSGRLTDDQRGGYFGPAVPVREGASAQDRLLGYLGRQP